jgi:hypothetical protein
MKILTVAGIILFISPIFFLGNAYDKFKVEKDGHLVQMRIEKLPASCIGAKMPYFVTFSYQGQFFDKQTRGNFCEKHHIGELIEIQFLEGAKHILFPKESAVFNLVSCGLLSIFGLVFIIIQWKKSKNEK